MIVTSMLIVGMEEEHSNHVFPTILFSMRRQDNVIGQGLFILYH